MAVTSSFSFNQYRGIFTALPALARGRLGSRPDGGRQGSNPVPRGAGGTAEQGATGMASDLQGNRTAKPSALDRARSSLAHSGVSPPAPDGRIAFRSLKRRRLGTRNRPRDRSDGADKAAQGLLEGGYWATTELEANCPGWQKVLLFCLRRFKCGSLVNEFEALRAQILPGSGFRTAVSMGNSGDQERTGPT